MGRLQRAFLDALQEEQVTQRQWADAAGLPRSNVSRLALGQGQRLSDEMIGALANNWTNPETSRKILLAYFQDELERAGLSPDTYRVRIDDAAPNPLAEDLDVIEEALGDLSKRSLRQAVHALADLLRSSRAQFGEKATIPVYEMREEQPVDEQIAADD